MSNAPSGPSGRPFTLVVCASCDPASAQVLEGLRRAVRGCRHGVMVSTGCLQTVLHCRHPDGLYAAVQPCAEDRRPSGNVVRLGPLVTDAEAVGSWLRAGMPDDATLPGRLRAAPAPQAMAYLN